MANKSEARQSGGCQCGAVRFSVSKPPESAAAVCHCLSCRKSVGAPLVGWAMFTQDAVQVSGVLPTVYVSSEGVKRSFCGTCGTSLFFEADYISGLIDITTESFDDPDAMTPTAQIWVSQEGACMKTLKDMVRFDALPPNAG